MKLSPRPIVIALSLALTVASIGAAYSQSSEQTLLERASHGDLDARIQLAEFYKRTSAEAKALEQLEIAATEGRADAHRLLGQHYTRQDDEAQFRKGVDHYQQAVNLGDPEARIAQGIALASRAMNPDLDRAERAKYGQRASKALAAPARDGHADAAWTLGYLHAAATPGVMPSVETAESLITTAADAGQPAAAFWLARHYEHIQATGLDATFKIKASDETRAAAPQRFKHYLELAALAGHVGAMEELARRYRHGDGVPASAEAALFWDAKVTEHRGQLFRVSDAPPAPQSGISSAAHTLSAAEPAPAPAPPLVQAPSAPVAPSPAPRTTSADALPTTESVLAQTRARLAQAEQRIRDLEAERDAALARIDSLTAQLEDVQRYRSATGNANELNSQGLALFQGRDYHGAERYFRLAAESGDPAASANLGLLYLRGWGVDQSTRTAVRLFKQASNAGNLIASENLGEIYARGIGVDRDVKRARDWYERALAQGSRTAHLSLQQLHDHD
jgi:TPR repeat protein